MESIAASLWSAVEAHLYTHFQNPDIEAAKVLFAAVAAHKIIEHPPAWIMAIAPSGSMKTALLDTLHGLPGVHFADEVTTTTFISGYVEDDHNGTRKRQAPASYLHRLGQSAILVAADFSTVLSMDSRKRPIILAQLRRIYDGRFNREFGTGTNLSENTWQGRLTLLAGVTPDVDKHFAVLQSLGERFTRTRWDRAAGLATGEMAIDQHMSDPTALRHSVSELLLPILSCPCIDPPFLSLLQRRAIASLGEFTALARVQVSRARESHEVDDIPVAEGNTRISQQLAQISRGWAVVQRSGGVTDAAMKLSQRAALDSIPPVRRAVLEAIIQSRSPYTSGVSPVLVSRAVEDLEAIGLIRHSRNAIAQLSDYGVSLIAEFFPPL